MKWPDCIDFKGGIDHNGYGRVQRNRRKLAAHRVVWMDAYGEIPPGMYVLHNCDNRRCINLQHLRLGTHYDNMQDRFERSARSLYGRCGHPLFGDNLRIDRKGKRFCRTCDRERNRTNPKRIAWNQLPRNVDRKRAYSRTYKRRRLSG